MDDAYDPEVYENTPANYGKIVGMLFLFYIFQGLHWWANFELGIHDTESSTVYNLIVFGAAVITIGCMLIYGSGVNKKKVTHEFYQEKISAEKLRQAEEQAKAAQKAANAANLAKWESWTKLSEGSWNRNSLAHFEWQSKSMRFLIINKV